MAEKGVKWVREPGDKGFCFVVSPWETPELLADGGNGRSRRMGRKALHCTRRESRAHWL